MFRFGLAGALCLSLATSVVAGPSAASAQASPAPTRAVPAAPTPRASRDLIVPPGFGPSSSASVPSSELIVPEIFRDRGSHAALRTPRAWERPGDEPVSELRVPPIFQAAVVEEPSFNPQRIDDGPRVPEAFRAAPAPAAGPIYRVRDELRAPGFAVRPPTLHAPTVSARPAPPSPGLGRRLSAPAR